MKLRKLIQKNTDNRNDKKLAFIISGGRTGTLLLGESLSKFIDDCHSEHEPDVLVLGKFKTIPRIRTFGVWHMIIGRILNQTGTRIIGQKFCRKSISEEKAVALLKRSRKKYHDTIKETLIIESNSQWWALTHLINKAWPAAKIAVIVRDPRDWIRSWINKSGRYDRYDLVAYIPPGRLTPQKVGDHKWAQHWEDFSTFEKLAWEWMYIYSTITSHSTADQENIKLYRFEDLFSTEEDTLEEMVNFITLHRDKKYGVSEISKLKRITRNSSSGLMPHWKNWNPDQVASINRICGDLMHKFSYGNEAEWKDMSKKANGN